MTDPDSEGLQQHPLVDALVPDPSQVAPNARRIVGYLGRSSSTGVWRLYLSQNLDRYVEIPEADILHTQQLPGTQGTAVWVRRGIRFQYVQVQVSQVEADYLSGPIATAASQAPAAFRAFASPQACLANSRVPQTTICYVTRVCTHAGGPGCGGGGGDSGTEDPCSFGCETTVWCSQPSECQPS